MSEGVRLAREGRIATLTLDRPPLNVLDLPTLEALRAAAAGLAREEGLQLVVVRGAGGRAFSAGVAVQDHTREKIAAALPAFHAAIRAVRAVPAPTLAAVQGHCLGGGLELALACDWILATDDARFGQPEVLLGCFPPVAAALLPRRVGEGRALELLLSGRTFDCDEAERLGLVTWRVGANLDEALERVTPDLLARSAAVTPLVKRAVRAAAERPFEEALTEAERIYLEELTATEDVDEGIAAFLEKRPPSWRHR
ncbi:MAG TPA: enoyl-CoA hydratase/isomerase family protein [Thermoanaerobaculia bacterium]|nr:enoyl-CoA hydratase/isomerase family protein [Thermoanaerobaculia bacterium]